MSDDAVRGPCANCGNASHWARNAVGLRDKMRYCSPCFSAWEKNRQREAYAELEARASALLGLPDAKRRGRR